MKTKIIRFIIAVLVGGFAMWVIAGLWHNLILPFFSEDIEAHHEGLLLMLIAYFILSLLMTYIYFISYRGGNRVLAGLKIGIVIGILWVFPHGLAMAGAHGTSVLYEINNALWHIVEQGIGGIIIALIIGEISEEVNISTLTE
jgi:hypothetical protein